MNSKSFRILSLEIFMSLLLTLIIIVLSSRFTLNFKPIYYYDLVNYNISEQTGFTNKEIKENYDYIVGFVGTWQEMDFHLPSMNYSDSGKQHFVDVKDLFNNLDVLLIISLVLLSLSLVLFGKKIKFKFLKYSSLTLLILPLILGTFFFINFDTSFTMFHKIFFRNDMWLFDPSMDPIINILPQEFFYHSAISILLGLALCSMISLFIYKRINK
ncbi:TIGR01906 family membrane protein [Clostridium grantii]|uniref:Integral membrane protein TIGR01906 n=1 Tax=Clostridium grantii DSM 8605 TaxID=1121316 RepID=A0A1M5XET0_9CLOT|nr:TIGR01906 family membrane protein [Clostridium grantii]SHH98385.1 integral membrane protein TIGR01906 [Clostridium grantii DSM 8605]